MEIDIVDETVGPVQSRRWIFADVFKPRRRSGGQRFGVALLLLAPIVIEVGALAALLTDAFSRGRCSGLSCWAG